MQITHRGNRVVIIDDFLDDTALAEIRTMMTRSTFTETQSVIYPDTDGPAFRSRGMVLEGTAGSEAGAGRPKAYEKILKTAAAEAALFGAVESEWDRIGFAFWRYPAGSKLSWHNDAGGGRQGEFILFLHDAWNVSWGGELMILDENPPPSGDAGGDVVSRMASQVRESGTCPIAILPRPNRLVLVQAGTAHQINRVDPTAESMRCTLTGFISKKSAATSGAARDALARLAGEPAGSDR